MHIPIDEAGVEHDASASIENTGAAHSRDEWVPLQTLDSYRFEDVELIKIDVEGHEYSVIKGQRRRWPLRDLRLLVEIEQRHSRKANRGGFRRLLAFGYQGFFMMGTVG